MINTIKELEAQIKGLRQKKKIEIEKNKQEKRVLHKIKNKNRYENYVSMGKEIESRKRSGVTYKEIREDMGLSNYKFTRARDAFGQEERRTKQK